MSKVAKNNQNLIFFKDGYQLAEINGVSYQFDFTEAELANSIELYRDDLVNRSGFYHEDYTEKEMAIEIASYWEETDVERLIADLPESELADYIVIHNDVILEEVGHAA